MDKKVKKLLKFIGIISICIAFVGILIVLKYINPEKSSIYPPCLIYKLTGIKCAGCGMTRAIHYLLNFEIEKSFKLNPLLFVFLVYIVYGAIKYIVLKFGYKKMVSINDYIIELYILLIITVIFMIIRNVI